MWVTRIGVEPRLDERLKKRGFRAVECRNTSGTRPRSADRRIWIGCSCSGISQECLRRLWTIHGAQTIIDISMLYFTNLRLPEVGVARWR